MPNPNLIKPKQLDQPLFVDFIKQTTSGDISSAIVSYAATGYQGSNVVYASGGAQTVLGQKTFDLPLGVPYSGSNSQTISKLYVSDQVTTLQTKINANALNLLHTSGNESAQGIKTFDSVVINQGITGSRANITSTALVPNVNLIDSPDFRSAINLNYFYNQGILFNTGNQIILDTKQFITSPTIN